MDTSYHTPRFTRSLVGPGESRASVLDIFHEEYEDHPITLACWSERQVARVGQGVGVAVHLQGDAYGGQEGFTLCGIERDGEWGEDAHEYPPDEFRGCVRCQRAWWRRYGGNAAEAIPLSEQTYTITRIDDCTVVDEPGYRVCFTTEGHRKYARFARTAPELPADFALSWRHYQLVKVYREQVFVRYRFELQGEPTA